MNNEYWRIFKFNSIDELNNFEESLKTLTKPIEKKLENRGSKTKELHVKIKEYLKTHPEMSYRDALKNYKNIVK